MTIDSKVLSAAIKNIEDGKLISITGSSFDATQVCIGDFRSIGWAKRCSNTKGIWYEWHGPNPVSVSGKVVHPFSSTEFVEMDWS